MEVKVTVTEPAVVHYQAVCRVCGTRHVAVRGALRWVHCQHCARVTRLKWRVVDRGES